ncbi:MAG: hypothetical protein H6838_18060 [Planctomycetes bacterium]|nr:hypothetical protein [Planctomycetota bacterium]MCB9887401.1 hypothetical protein [Planctomycetota bacterium]
MNVANAAAALCLTCLLSAQQEAQPAPPRPAAVTVTLQFGGGTLEKFVREVRVVQPKANIVVATRAAEAVLPPIDLRNAGLEQALQGACEVAESDYEVRVRDYNGPGEPVYSIVTSDKPTRATRATSNQSSSGGGLTTFSKVYSLARLTDAARQPGGVEPMRVETVLSAIEAANQDDKNPPVLRFHRDSGLLIVRGNAGQQAGVEMLLNVLENDRGAPRPGRGSSPQETAGPDRRR